MGVVLRWVWPLWGWAVVLWGRWAAARLVVRLGVDEFEVCPAQDAYSPTVLILCRLPFEDASLIARRLGAGEPFSLSGSLGWSGKGPRSRSECVIWYARWRGVRVVIPAARELGGVSMGSVSAVAA